MFSLWADYLSISEFDGDLPSSSLASSSSFPESALRHLQRPWML